MADNEKAILGEYRLRRPIKKPNGELTGTLVLVEPTARDIQACGFPFSVDMVREGGEAVESVRFNHGAVLRYIQRLSGMTSTDVDTMHPADVFRITADLVGFFGAEEVTPATSSPGTSTSP